MNIMAVRGCFWHSSTVVSPERTPESGTMREGARDDHRKNREKLGIAEDTTE